MLHVQDLIIDYAGGGRRARAEDAVRAVDGVSFDVAPGQLFTLLGPSGCGKTTTLRSVAGLESPSGGSITIGDRLVYSAAENVDVPADERRLGMVFQSYAIWPHMTVAKNVSFPLELAKRRARPSRAEIRARVEKVLAVTELDAFADRPATKLSGGQQQRLALARALVIEPQLLLLDEPLSNLDAKLRESMRMELKRLQRDLGLTAVYVTHDQVEALAMSSVIAVMNGGKIVQMGTPREIYERPNSRFVADFIGTSNLLPAVVAGAGPDGTSVRAGHAVLRSADRVDAASGADLLVSLRPEDLSLAPHDPAAPPAGDNELAGVVTARAFLGEATEHVVRVGDRSVRCRSNPSLSIEPGRDVTVRVAPEKVRLVPLG
ncbi:ABC transporter ATP-binding protein [Actinomadura rayongensis]|uniref:ATP-binding cassette domain-containing protein n=1 Tax=Actinomadura rayongensis TaxID=1429076 RepID=A0A6I4W9A7_9ACTN|nr:ABC transporter ATP-binding protein [Actinomadura rayongensis]MXQ67409.1 ATP-binding cassette domain-containing protein [Actinomadura rayongensis]